MTQWECQKCKHRFLWIRKGLATRPTECPECGNEKVEVREV